ncbi:UDP-N-acetylmuramoylalanyl-D-glutamyl-2,6-diaminopimelate--D-alanyl-D-alanine ligase [Amphiplicatus metriothermophilus]|uniref:UDP-N-acetylmuramoyl-tripeptide--D-alanyl-D-alanine ligase n=1 Tax=Amphiplicatus metriothermophilus TaxID=1519374 RepID=A0A239PT62_9PROT|nr:UDP-N-acetylmuramoylalanyl-D-glutamyl-2,6-diaminopimelate--D-alanyl-D-alanine ligase [Amphiplicatus metriothermophilus]MBB5519249.1 UDP-N-acetylmuramoyl-tripeptide--D-alanyl-D-alanine ligase [Amphiplicatus metriothermophilus]SNT73318.1 UDP-N-acetylmuramoyl-tripeptide--D-alanyl-D-alanine ligase [Amphiplicatus metriothermophilus]
MTAALWTAYEAAAATGGALCARGGDPDRWIAEEWAARGLSIDSRTLKPGDMFVALKDARDGHDFVAAAFEKGAAAALVARAPEDAPDGKPLLVVRDTLEGLRDLARAARLRNFGKRVAVTGSAGKTSAKEMLRVALGAAGRAHAAEKSFNNHWGVPLTLAQLPMNADYGVFEIGMNHAGEITPLTRLVRPHAAIVTTVGPAHLEFFGSVEKIAEAKAEIFLGLAPGGVAIIPADNEHCALLRRRAEKAGAARIVSFGARDGADLRLLDYAEESDGARIEAQVFGEDVAFRLGAPGRHQAMNALAVLAAVRAVGAPLVPAMEALARFAPSEGRGARREIALSGGRRITLIDESYNANPASMAAALALLGAAKPRGRGRRIAVLGEMLELGPDAPKLHAQLADALAAAKVDRLYAAGALMRHLWEAAPAAMRGRWSEKADDVLAALRADLADGDVVMVKGSNASKISLVARALESEEARPKAANE